MRQEAMMEGGDTVCRMRAARGYSQEAFAQEAVLNKAYMGGIERGQDNFGAVNLHRIEEALDLSLSERFAEVEGYGSPVHRSSSANIPESVVPSALASRSAATMKGVVSATRQEVLRMSGSLCIVLIGRRHVTR